MVDKDEYPQTAEIEARCENLAIQRIPVRHGVSRDLGSLLMGDMKQARDYFAQHPIQLPMSGGERAGSITDRKAGRFAERDSQS